MKKISIFLLDKVGIITSIVCLIHCFSTPILFLFGFGILSTSINQEWFDIGIVVFVMLIGIAAFRNGFLVHNKKISAILFSAGIILLFSGEMIENERGHYVLIALGAISIISAHFWNLYYLRKSHAV